MAVKTYEGVHTTCTAIAERILEVGFLPSSEDRYVGAGVYFFDKAKRGIRNTKKYQKLRQKRKECPEDDKGVLLCADITCDKDYILDLEEGEHSQPFYDFIKKKREYVENELSLSIQDEEERKKERDSALNGYRFEYVKGLEEILHIKYDMVKIAMPYIQKAYGSGFVVYRTDCIGHVSFCEGETV